MAGLIFLPVTFRALAADCVPSPSGLVAWWPGEGNAHDIAGTNSGALSGGVTFTNGEVEQAFSFDGTNGTLVVPDSSSLRLTTQLTIEAWINPRSTNADQAIIGKLGVATGNNGYELFLSQQNGLSAQFNRPGQDWPGNVIAHANSSAIVPHVWYHVAWTYDQSAMKLYLNGLPVATNVIGPQAIAVSSADLRISGLDNHVYFDGLIDEPSVYNRALSDREIAAIYNAGSAGKCPPPLTNCVPSPSGLVSWWPGEGNANDFAGANDGTLSNGAGFASGMVGQAFSFDGINDYVRIPKSANLDAPNQLTIDFWMKADPSQPIGSQVVGLVTSDFYGFEIGTSASKVGVVFFVSTDNGGHFVLTTDLNSSGAAFPAGEWHHVAGVYDGAKVQLYLDGKALGNPAAVTGQISPMLANSFVAIGSSDGRTTCSQCFGSRYFKGMIDEVDFFNRALSASEIAAIYNAGSAGKCWSADCVPPPAGLVSWWPGGGNANDIVGSNNGAPSGGVLFTNGEVGQAFDFNGVDAYVEVANSSNLNPAASFSIEGWIFPRKDQTSVIMAKWADTPDTLNQRSYCLDTYPNKALMFGISDWAHQWDASFQTFSTTNNVFGLNEWSHVAAVYDQPAGARRIYVNGVKVAERIDPPITVTNSTARVGIGAVLFSDTGSRDYFDGLIDELSFYSTALSTAEIQAIYNAGSAGKCASPPSTCIPPPSGLVGWWPGQGDANDIAGANNGTLSNGVGFASGVVGQAFSFDGINDYVRIPKSASLDAPNQLTIDFWMKADPSTPVGSRTAGLVSSDFYGIEIGAVGESNVGIEFYTSTDGGVNFAHTSDPTGQGAVFPAGEWHHVAGTYDGAHMQLYIDGLPWGQPRFQANPISPMLANSFVAIGSEDGRRSCGSCIGSRYFMGLIDEVDIFNRALSASEIAAIYNAGSAGKCRSAPAPHAATATATVVNGFVVGASIVDGGWGYTNTPVVRIIDGGGSGAQAVAVVSNGVVIAVNILNTGNGYTNTPAVVIEPPFIAQPTMGIAAMSLLSFTNLASGTNYQFQVLLGNTWSNLGAAFTAAGPTFTQYVSGTADPSRYHLATTPLPLQAHATAQRVNGFVVGATVTSGGLGYVTNPAVTIVGGGGTNATAVSHVSGGRVTSISIIDAGNGYTSTPTIQIAPPPPGFALSPTVQSVIRLDSANLAPYENYQIQLTSDVGRAWGNWDGGLFRPTEVTNSQYLFITNGVGFFRLQYVP